MNFQPLNKTHEGWFNNKGMRGSLSKQNSPTSKIFLKIDMLLSILYIKKTTLFQHVWVEFFFSKIPSFFNTNNTCNK